MTYAEAVAYVHDHDDDDVLDDDDLIAVFTAIYERAPDAEDYEGPGLWSLICAGVD